MSSAHGQIPSSPKSQTLDDTLTRPSKSIVTDTAVAIMTTDIDRVIPATPDL